MKTVTATTELPKPPAPMELWERNTVLAYFGGDKPLHISTLYRGINTGIYPGPITISGNGVRWLASECRDALQRMIGGRDKPKTKRGPKPKRRKRAA